VHLKRGSLLRKDFFTRGRGNRPVAGRGGKGQIRCRSWEKKRKDQYYLVRREERIGEVSMEGGKKGISFLASERGETSAVYHEKRAEPRAKECLRFFA